MLTNGWNSYVVKNGINHFFIFDVFVNAYLSKLDIPLSSYASNEPFEIHLFLG